MAATVGHGSTEISAQGEVEIDPVAKALFADGQVFDLGVEGASLGFEHGDDFGQTRGVFVLGQALGTFGLDGGFEEFLFAGDEVFFARQGVLDLLECGQDGLGIVEVDPLGFRLGTFEVGLESTALEEWLGQSPDHAPDGVIGIDDIGEILAGRAGRTGQAKGGQETLSGLGDPQVGAASRRSAARMSGRRLSNSEGRPAGTGRDQFRQYIDGFEGVCRIVPTTTSKARTDCSSSWARCCLRARAVGRIGQGQSEFER